MTGSAKENRALHGRMTRASRAGKLNRFEKHVNKAVGDCADEGKQKKAGELLRYVSGHMDAIAGRYKEGMPDSCTEAQVRHFQLPAVRPEHNEGG